METSKKFKVKRLTNTFMTVAYSCLTIFVLIIITSVILLSGNEIQLSPFMSRLIVFTALFGLIFGMVFALLAGIHQQRLIDYRKNIRIYRSRKFAVNTIEYLQAGEIRKAINEYRKCNYYPDDSLDAYLYGMLIAACYLSEEVDLLTPARKVDELKERFNPNKIVFN